LPSAAQVILYLAPLASVMVVPFIEGHVGGGPSDATYLIPATKSAVVGVNAIVLGSKSFR
jgi:hypothetical protein